MFLCTKERPRPRPCAPCGRPTLQLCDGPVTTDGKRRTCDAPVCVACAVRVETIDRDYCPRCGGRDVYARQGLTREQKRDGFRAWIDVSPASVADVWRRASHTNIRRLTPARGGTP